MADHTGYYLKAIARTPLLTAEEEIVLSRKIQTWLVLRDRIGPLTKEERRAMKNGERAYKRFMEANLKLVVSIAKKYTHYVKSQTLMDLVQEGNLGLARAVEKFDGTRGYKFSTYAYWWVRQSITRAIQMQDRLVRLPSHAHELMTKVRFFQQQYFQANGESPPLDLIADHFNVSPEMFRAYINFECGITSLDRPANTSDGQGTTIGELVADPNQDLDDKYEAMSKQEFYDQLPPLIARLTPKQQEVVQLRFFSDAWNEPSFSKISMQINVSRQAVSANVKNAVESMRRQYKRSIA